MAMKIFTSDSHDIIHFQQPWQYSLPVAMTFTCDSHYIIHLTAAIAIFTSDGHDSIHFRQP
jgi:hypothetical protein